MSHRFGRATRASLLILAMLTSFTGLLQGLAPGTAAAADYGNAVNLSDPVQGAVNVIWATTMKAAPYTEVDITDAAGATFPTTPFDYSLGGPANLAVTSVTPITGGVRLSTTCLSGCSYLPPLSPQLTVQIMGVSNPAGVAADQLTLTGHWAVPVFNIPEVDTYTSGSFDLTPGLPITVNLSDTAQAAPGVTWSTAVNPQPYDQIDIADLAGAAFPLTAGDYFVGTGDTAAYGVTSVVSMQGGGVQLTTTCAQGACGSGPMGSSPLTLRISDVTNPANATSDQLVVNGLSRTNYLPDTYTSGSFAFTPATVTSVGSVTLGNNVGGVPTTWTVPFVSGASVAAGPGPLYVSVGDDLGTVLPSDPQAYQLTVAGTAYTATSVIPTLGIGPTQVYFGDVPAGLASGLLPDTPGTLTISGAINALPTAASKPDFVHLQLGPNYASGLSPQFALVQPTAVTGVTASTDTAAPGASADWQFNFTTGNGAPLSAGENITIGDQLGLEFPNLAADYAIAPLGGSSFHPSAVVAGRGQAGLTLPSGASVGAGTAVTVTVDGATNPAAIRAGATDQITVSTSLAPAGQSPALPVGPVNLVVAPSSSVAGATGTTWTVSFTMGLVAPPQGSALLLSDALDAAFSGAAGDYTLAVGGGAGFAPATAVVVPGGGVTLSVPPGQNIPAGATVTVLARDVTNPAAGTDSLTLTVAGAVPATAVPFLFGARGGQFQLTPLFSVLPLTGGAPGTWTVTVTSPAALVAGTDTLTITAPAGTQFPTAGSDYTVADATAGGAGVSLAAGPTLSASGSAATLTLPLSAAVDDTLELTVSGVTAPPAGIYPGSAFSVASSAAPTAVNPVAGLTFAPAVAGTSGTPALPPSDLISVATRQPVTIAAGGLGPCSSTGETVPSKASQPTAGSANGNNGIGGNPTASVGDGQQPNVATCQITDPSGLDAQSTYTASGPNISIPLDCKFTVESQATDVHTNTMWVFQDVLTNANSASTPGVGVQDPLYTSSFNRTAKNDYVGEVAPGSVVDQGNTANLASITDATASQAQNFYDGNFVHCAFQLQDSSGNPVSPVVQMATAPGQAGAGQVTTSIGTLQATLPSVSGSYQLAYDVWVGQKDTSGNLVDGPQGCAWTENDQEANYSIDSSSNLAISQAGFPHAILYSQWTFDGWQGSGSPVNRGAIQCQLNPAFQSGGGAATNGSAYAAKWSPGTTGWNIGNGFDNTLGNAFCQGVGACTAPLGGGAESSTERHTGALPLTIEVAPLALLQLDVTPYKILYSPPGDQSQASFALTSGSSASTQVSFGSSSAQLTAADASTATQSQSTQDNENKALELLGATNQTTTTTNANWDQSTSQTNTAGSSQTGSVAWTDTSTRSWQTAPSAQQLQNPDVPPWYYDEFALSVHPQLGVWDMASVASGGSPVSTTSSPGGPTISSVTFSGGGANAVITVNGHGFGTTPLNVNGSPLDLNPADPSSCPRVGCDSPDFSFGDGTTGWAAGGGVLGGGGAGVTLKYAQWTDTQIVISGFGSVYGNTFQTYPGDAVGVAVTNPGSGKTAHWSGTFTTGAQAALQYSLLNTDSTEVDVTARQLLLCAEGTALPLPGDFTPPVQLPPAECASLLSLDPFAAAASQSVDPSRSLGTLATKIQTIARGSPGAGTHGATGYTLSTTQTLTQQTGQSTSFQSSVTDILGNAAATQTTSGFSADNILAGVGIGAGVVASFGPVGVAAGAVLAVVGLVGAGLFSPGVSSGPTTSTGNSSTNAMTVQVNYQQSATDSSVIVNSASATLQDDVNPVESTVWLDSRFDTLAFQVPTASVSSVTPPTGPASGGTQVTMLGSGFWSGPVAVEFCVPGGTACTPGTNVQALSDTELTVDAPPLPTGSYDVRVQGPGGLSAAVQADTFTSSPGGQAAAQVTGVSPTGGPTGGGTAVTIQGTGLASATEVWFGTSDPTQNPALYAVYQQVYAQAPTPANALPRYAPARSFYPVSNQEIVACAPAVSAAGTVYISVLGPDGWTATGPDDVFTYTPGAAQGGSSCALPAVVAPPAVTGLDPAGGPASGGTTITIRGLNFQSELQPAACTAPACPAPGTAVNLVLPPPVQFCPVGGGACVPATNVALSGSTSLTATVPPGTGAADVQVGGSYGFSAVSIDDQFTYAAPTGPLGPGAGSIALGANPLLAAAGVGSTTLLATVLNTLDQPVSGAAVQFLTTLGAFSVAQAVYGNPSVSQAVYTNAAGQAAVALLSPSVGQAMVTASVYNPAATDPLLDTHLLVTFEPVPVVTGLSASTGTAAGGTQLTIGGFGFTGATAVYFGTVPAAAFTVENATTIVATSPPGAGTVDVTVANGAVQGGPYAADSFTYLGSTSGSGTGPTAPSVTGVSPGSGPPAGGTTVAITGSGFTGATFVDFGAVAAAGFKVNATGTEITATAPPGSPGAVNVTVTGPGGTSIITAGDLYTYLGTPSAPTVVGLSPAAGPASGGTPVTITGGGFTGATAVDFGANAASSFQVNASGTEITATAPPGASGTVDITVVGPGGTSATSAADRYTYVVGPVVTGVTPGTGPAAGGTPVTISGAGFQGATAVAFGTTAVFGFHVSADGTGITAVAPGGSAGAVHVTVSTSGGTSPVSVADLFSYVGLPVVSAVTPANGPVGGGTAVTIYGSGFVPGSTTVAFGGSTATGVVVDPSGLRLTATAPAAAAAGPVDVTVTVACGTAGCGTSTEVAADRFFYLDPPTVASVLPTNGPTLGGTSVTINGSGFASAVAVDFGDTPAVSFAVSGDRQITAASPAAAAGVVDVVVTTQCGAPATPSATSCGTSANGVSDRFTYLPGTAVSGVTPANGPVAGGTAVTITGTGFTTATAVHFGDKSATGFTVNGSGTSITATTPAAPLGTVAVTVTTDCGTAATGGATGCGTSAQTTVGQFTFLPLPTVTAVSPAHGLTSGTTAVTISGTGFATATAVDFGGTAASAFSVQPGSDQISATVPAGAVGAIDVTVTTACGTPAATSCGASPVSAADRFTYYPASAATVIRTLVPGWNTLSIPFPLANPDLRQILSDGAQSLLVAYAFQNNGWVQVRMRHQDALQQALRGLYLYIGGNQPVTATLIPVGAPSGGATLPPSPNAPPSLSLGTGWNLVGPSAPLGTESYSDFLTGVSPNVAPLLIDPNGTGVPVTNPASDGADAVRNGYAYWLYASQPGQTIVGQILTG